MPAALKDFYESDRQVFEQKDALYQEKLPENNKGSTYTGAPTGLSQPFPYWRRLSGDQSVASAAMQSVKHISRSIQPDNGIVKSAISEIYKILEQMEKGKPLVACYGTSRENGLWTWGKRSVKQLRLQTRQPTAALM